MAKINLFFICIFLISSLGIAANYPQKKFSYRAEVPSSGETCADHAKTLGALFQNVTGLAVISAHCAGQNTLTEEGKVFTRDIITLNYMSDREARPSKTILGGEEFLGQIYESAGLFSSYSVCLNQIPTQVELYEKETHLHPIASYCEHASNFSAADYSMVIESFGDPQKKLFLFSENLVRSALQNSNPELSKAEAKVIEESGGHIAYSDPFHILYYSKNPVAVRNGTFTYFSSKKQCTDQVGMARAIFTNAGSKSVTALCLDDGSLAVVSNYNFSVQEYLGNQMVYSSYSDCMNDRKRVLENYRSQGAKPLGLICDNGRYSNNLFVMHVYYKSP